MPLASQETIDRVTNVLLNGTYHMRRAVLRETPINPPHGDKSMFTKAQISDTAHDFVKLKITNVADMIRFFKLGAVERDQIGAITFVTRTPADLPKVAQRAGWVPCWFLPWSSARIIKLKISSFVTDPVLNFGPGIDPVANPDLFFTAGINGCSVFAVGATTNPSVYHAGIDPGDDLAVPLQPTETTEAAWRRLLGRIGTTKFVGSVGKTDYIKELNSSTPTDDTDRFKFNNAKTTRLAAQLEAQLQANGALTNVMVLPWGAVFGLRDPGTHTWTMTLVKNSTVTYHRVVRTVKKRFLREDKVTVASRGEIRPRTTLPKNVVGLPDISDATTATSEQVISCCANLGFTEFFPSGGVVQVRYVNNIQLY